MFKNKRIMNLETTVRKLNEILSFLPAGTRLYTCRSCGVVRRQECFGFGIYGSAYYCDACARDIGETRRRNSWVAAHKEQIDQLRQNEAEKKEED